MLERPAVEQYGVAPAGFQCRELIHDAGPRANEHVLGRLAQPGDIQRGHLDAPGCQHGDGAGDLEGTR